MSLSWCHVTVHRMYYDLVRLIFQSEGTFPITFARTRFGPSARNSQFYKWSQRSRSLGPRSSWAWGVSPQAPSIPPPSDVITVPREMGFYSSTDLYFFTAPMSGDSPVFSQSWVLPSKAESTRMVTRMITHNRL